MYYLLIILLLLVVALGVFSIKIVKQSEVGMVERLGKFQKEIHSGLNFIVPILDRVVYKIDLRTQVLDSEPQPVITKDNVTMMIDTVIYYQITDPFKATYEIKGLHQAIRYLTTTTLRDVIGSLDLDETLSSRDDINKRLRLILDDATDKWGVRVERVEVKNIEPPQDIKDAMEKQMRAERTRRSQILEAEGEKRSAILKAEGEKESAILQAQGRKEAKILDAEAEKEAQIRMAEGQARAITEVAFAQAEQIKQVFTALKNVDLDEKVLSVKYIEALEKMAEGENKVFVPFEATGLLGSIGTVRELLDKSK